MKILVTKKLSSFYLNVRITKNLSIGLRTKFKDIGLHAVFPLVCKRWPRNLTSVLPRSYHNRRTLGPSTLTYHGSSLSFLVCRVRVFSGRGSRRPVFRRPLFPSCRHQHAPLAWGWQFHHRHRGADPQECYRNQVCKEFANHNRDLVVNMNQCQIVCVKI